MEVKLNVQTDIARALTQLAWMTPEQLPKVVAHGLNKTMVTIRAKERAEMQAVFDRPKPFTLNGFFTVPAKPNRLEVEIRLKDFAGKGTPAAKYLAAEVYGGGRQLKRFERALQAAGILPAGMYAVPANGLPLDAFGNIPGGYIVQVLSYLRAFPEQGYVANRAARGTRRSQRRFYVVSATPSARDQRGLPAGIYERKGNTSRMVIAFVSAPTYRKRFDFFRVAEQTTARFLAADIRAAGEQAQRATIKAVESSLSGLIRDLIVPK